MDSIATYSDSRFEGRRRFELSADTIRVVGRTIRGDFEQTFQLSQISTNVARVWLHSGFFLSMFWGVLVSFSVFLAVLIYRDRFAYPSDLLGVILIGFIIMAFVSARKIEFVQLVSEAGVPLFDIARAGKRAGEFDAFIALLVDQIKKCRGLA